MLEEIKKELKDQNVKLVAVSKTKPISSILNLYHQGHHVFGENRVQELVEKQQQLPKDIEWHMIGHLQKNKVKYIAPFIHMIHAVDNVKLLQEINKQALKNNRTIDVLLQIKIATEESKFGMTKDDVIDLFTSGIDDSLDNVRVCGLMGMATFSMDMEQVRSEFAKLKGIFETIKMQFFQDQPHFKEISMGMSGDYKIAIEEGSTIVRIGSLIFGAR